MKKSFETLVWIGSEEGIDFISRTCDSAVDRISDMAKYWVYFVTEHSIEWLAEDENE